MLIFAECFARTRGRYSMMRAEGMILCGGEAKRLKPYLPFNKALAEIRPGSTLLSHQTSWLKKMGMSRIVLAIDEGTHRNLDEAGSPILDEVECSVESERLGTGGAVRRGIELVEAPFFYLMNVDDILISAAYRPQRLLSVHEENLEAAGSVLLARTSFPFGVVETSSSLVTGFRQKPILDFKVCAGHYTFTREAVEEYFPEKGNFEDTSLPRMAQDRRLYSHEFEGEWITINNIKQLEEAREKLNRLNPLSLP